MRAEISVERGVAEVLCTGSHGTTGFRLESSETVDPSGEAALSIGLLPAMALREDLRISTTVSARLLRNADVIQEIRSSWDRKLSRVRVHAAGSESPPNGSWVWLMFRRGVGGPKNGVEAHEANKRR